MRPKIFPPVIGPFLVATVTLRHCEVAHSHSRLRTFQMPQVPGGHHKTPNDWEKKFWSLGEVWYKVRDENFLSRKKCVTQIQLQWSPGKGQ